MRLRARLGDIELARDRLAKFLRGAQGPVRFAEKFARHENRVGLPGVNNVFRLCRRCNYADRAGDNSSFVAYALRERR